MTASPRHQRRGGGFFKSLFAEPKPPRLPRDIAKQWMDLRVQAFLLERQLQAAGQDRDDAQESPVWQAWADLDMALQGKWDSRSRSRAMDRAYKIASKKRLPKSKKVGAKKPAKWSEADRVASKMLEGMNMIANGEFGPYTVDEAVRRMRDFVNDVPPKYQARWNE